MNKIFPAILVGFLWIYGIAIFVVKAGVEPPSNDMTYLTLAIIVAGVLAGGDR